MIGDGTRLGGVVELNVCLPGWVLLGVVTVASAPRVMKEIAGLIAMVRRRRRAE